MPKKSQIDERSDKIEFVLSSYKLLKSFVKVLTGVDVLISLTTLIYVFQESCIPQ